MFPRLAMRWRSFPSGGTTIRWRIAAVFQRERNWRWKSRRGRLGRTQLYPPDIRGGGQVIPEMEHVIRLWGSAAESMEIASSSGSKIGQRVWAKYIGRRPGPPSQKDGRHFPPQSWPTAIAAMALLRRADNLVFVCLGLVIVGPRPTGKIRYGLRGHPRAHPTARWIATDTEAFGWGTGST